MSCAEVASLVASRLTCCISLVRATVLELRRNKNRGQERQKEPRERSRRGRSERAGHSPAENKQKADLRPHRLPTLPPRLLLRLLRGHRGLHRLLLLQEGRAGQGGPMLRLQNAVRRGPADVQLGHRGRLRREPRPAKTRGGRGGQPPARDGADPPPARREPAARVAGPEDRGGARARQDHHRVLRLVAVVRSQRPRRARGLRLEQGPWRVRRFDVASRLRRRGLTSYRADHPRHLRLLSNHHFR